MIKKENSVWVDLYNCLFILSSDSKELEKLASPIFEPFDELELAMINGLKDSSLNLFLEYDWIDKSTKDELVKFRDFVNKINAELWNFDDFASHEDWSFAKKWALYFLNMLGEERRGWDSTGESIVTC